jgi:hypothetical protein
MWGGPYFTPIYYLQSKNEKNIMNYLNSLKEGPVAYQHMVSQNDVRYSLGAKNLFGKLKTFFAYRKKFYSSVEKIELTNNVLTTPERMILDFIKIVIRRKLSNIMYDKVYEGEKFFVLPLQWSLESQTTAREPLYQDQISLIELISKTLPEGVYLYVRPHPHWQCSDIEVSKLFRIKKLKNVKFVPHNLNIRKLIQDSLGAITVNSTVGLEAVALGKPVITFGHEFYAIEGVSEQIRDLRDLAPALLDIANGKTDVNEEARKEFIEKYISHNIVLESEFGVYGVMINENDGKKLADALVKCYDHLLEHNR